MVGADVMPPRLQAAGEALDHPHPRFRFWFAGDAERRFAGLIHGHAFRDELVPAEQTVDEFARLAIILKAARLAPRLVVEHDDFGAPADFFVVTEAAALSTDRTAVHADPQAVRPARRFG